MQSFSHMVLILVTFLELRFKENFKVYYYLVKLILLVALICGLQLDSPPEKNKELLFCKDV